MPYRRTENVVRRLEARRAAILEAARALASESGMAAVQIAGVAARADIAAGTVYRYFPSKTELVAALLGAVAESELTALRSAGDAAPGPLSALAAVIATFAGSALADRRLAWAALAEPVEPEADALRRDYRRALVAEFDRRICAAMAGGHLPEQEPALVARALLGALIEGTIGPLAPEIGAAGNIRDTIQTLTLVALRALGVIDARARGLVVQIAIPPRAPSAAG